MRFLMLNYATPMPFLAGCTIPAIHFGEKRVFINGKVCLHLRCGLITAMNWLRHWYYFPEKELRHQSKTINIAFSRTTERAASYSFSERERNVIYMSRWRKWTAEGDL